MGSEPETAAPQQRLEAAVGALLRLGVAAAAAIVLAGAVLYLSEFGSRPLQYHTFRGEPASLTTVPGIVVRAARLDSRGIIQLGLLVLIATPVARVLFSLFVFGAGRDRAYVWVTLTVLAVLLYSLLASHA